jgi:5-methyltetrahydropteroyltriglutamate--homocysteine methyltransferase
MKLSTERILTTHTGSLPRPAELTAALERRGRGELAAGELDAPVREAVVDVVRRQSAAAPGSTSRR